jgi:actin-like ATPase involved in cell morphogenesis
LKSGVEATVVAQTPFTTTRLLVGQFVVAQNTLKEALKQVSKESLFAVSPYIVIHPLEMVEGGLSEIEERIFREVAIGAGASKVVVWFGHELNDAEVKEKLGGS